MSDEQVDTLTSFLEALHISCEAYEIEENVPDPHFGGFYDRGTGTWGIKIWTSHLPAYLEKWPAGAIKDFLYAIQELEKAGVA